MRTFAFAAGLFAVASLASPLVARKEDCDDDGCACMTYDQATTVANNFKDLIVNYSNASAEAYLTTDFHDYSDSVNELINNGCPTGPAPLGSATFSSLAAFEAGQGSQPSIPFEILKMWHTCDTVVIRWRSSEPGAGSPNEVFPEEEVTGIVVMETVCNNSAAEPYLIKTVYSEFNSGAWLYDLGVFTPSCSSSKRSIEMPRML